MCPDGVVVGDSACFYSPEGTGRISDGSAEELCQSTGGHLASIANENDQAALVALNAKVGGRLYIGAKREGPNSDTWTWMDGTPWGYEDSALRSACMAGFETTVGIDSGRWCGYGGGTDALRVVCEKEGDAQDAAYQYDTMPHCADEFTPILDPEECLAAANGASWGLTRHRERL